MNGQNLKKLIISLVVIIIGLFTVFYFLIADIKSRNENISISDNQLSSKTTKQAITDAMINSLKNSELSISLINQSIVGIDDNVTFIENMESLAKSNNLKISIDSLNFQDDTALSTSKLSYFVIKAKVSGPWSGTYNFLSQLESLPIKVKIDKFSFANTQQDASKKNSGVVWESIFEIRVLKNK